MLLTKSVKTKWNSFTKKHYISKGYIYTKMDDEFEVKAEDLFDESHVKAEVKCDCCGCIQEIPWRQYKRQINKYENYYCVKCVRKLFPSKNRITKELLESKSFEKWCYDNLTKEEADEILSRWDYEKNKCSPSEILYSSHGFNKKGYWFKCPRRIHKSELKNINSFTSGYKGSIKCKQCNSFAQWGIDNLGEDFLEKYWDEKNDEWGIYPWEIDKSCNKKVWIKCQNTDYHKSYKVLCSSFVIGNRCPYCKNKNGKVHPLDSLGKLLEDKGLLYLWSEQNEKSPYEYTPKTSKKVWWKCPDGKHEDFYRSVYHSTSGCDFRCPSCVQERDESFLQEKVRLYLNELGYTILHEHNCTIVPRNPKTKQPLPFDNEIIELKLIIEVHGEQHYKTPSVYSSWLKKYDNSKQYLHTRQLYDRYKRIFAKKQGFFFLEIPYWTDDKEETWKKLIHNKIEEILYQINNNKL